MSFLPEALPKDFAFDTTRIGRPHVLPAGRGVYDSPFRPFFLFAPSALYPSVHHHAGIYLDLWSVDGFFVSNFVGKTPFAAVNFIMPFLLILGCVGFLFGTGGGA